MKNHDINRFTEMQTFVKVVNTGSFSSVARKLNKTPSSISKLISRLETRLSTRLVNRSTRGLQLTEEGWIFYEKCTHVLSELEEAERAISSNQEPTGNLNISCNIPFGKTYLLPLVPTFSTQYPKISLNISLTDTVVDLMSENADIAIRTGPLKDSSLIARKLGETTTVIVGSPQYFKNHSMPTQPKQLLQHNVLQFNFTRINKTFTFTSKGKKTSIKPIGNLSVSDGEAMRQLTLSGLGLARLARFQVEHDISSGKLIPILEDYQQENGESIYAVYLGQGQYLPARIRAMLDFLVDHVVVKK